MREPDKNLLEKMMTVPRRWSHLPTLDWYVLREFLIKFSILIFVCAILFMLGDVFRDLSDFLENDAPFGQTVLYFIMRLPGNISFVLPISVLLGCMWTMAMFGKNLEVTAMRASGLSLMRCGRSIFVMGLLVSLVNIWFNELLVPEYNEKSATLMNQLVREDRRDDRDKMLIYKSLDKRRIWLFRSFDEEGEQIGITIKFYREDESLDRYLTAERGEYNKDSGWTFYEGSITPYSLSGFMPKSPEPFEAITIGYDQLPEDPHKIDISARSAVELPCWSILEILLNTENMSEKAKSIYWTVFFSRLSFPWASLIAVFLGIPLATKNVRSGIMLAVITSVVVIIAYIVVSEAFKLFGMQGVINPIVAGFAPTLAFIAYGWWSVRRNRT